jgi:hypothetical protein
VENTAVVVVRLRVRGNASVQRLGEETVIALSPFEGKPMGPFFEVEVVERVEGMEPDEEMVYGFIDRAELVSAREASTEIEGAVKADE